MSKEAVAVKTLLAVFIAAIALAVVSTGLSWILEKNPGMDGRLDPPRAATLRTASASCGTRSEAAANGSSENSGTTQRLEATDPASALAEEVRERWLAVGERESQLLARQEAITLIHADILAEKATIDDVRLRVENELSRALPQTPGLTPTAQQLPTGTPPPAGSESNFAEARGGNADIAPTAYNSSDAGKAVALIQRLADNGNMDTAVKLLSVMNERQAAKILTAISDPHPDVAARLIEILQHRKQQEAAPTTASSGALRG